MKALFVWFGMCMTAAAATTFHLKDPATGALIGPVDVREGATVLIGGKAYTVTKVDGNANGLPLITMELRNVSAYDVLKHMAELSGAQLSSEGNTVTLRVKGGPTAEAPPAGMDPMDAFFAPLDKQPAPKKAGGNRPQ